MVLAVPCRCDRRTGVVDTAAADIGGVAIDPDRAERGLVAGADLELIGPARIAGRRLRQFEARNAGVGARAFTLGVVRRPGRREVQPGELRREVHRLGIAVVGALLRQVRPGRLQVAGDELRGVAVPVAGVEVLEGGHAVVEAADGAVTLAQPEDTDAGGAQVDEGAPHIQGLRAGEPRRGVAARVIRRASRRCRGVVALRRPVLADFHLGAVFQPVGGHRVEAGIEAEVFLDVVRVRLELGPGRSALRRADLEAVTKARADFQPVGEVQVDAERPRSWGGVMARGIPALIVQVVVRPAAAAVRRDQVTARHRAGWHGGGGSLGVSCPSINADAPTTATVASKCLRIRSSSLRRASRPDSQVPPRRLSDAPRTFGWNVTIRGWAAKPGRHKNRSMRVPQHRPGGRLAIPKHCGIWATDAGPAPGSCCARRGAAVSGQFGRHRPSLRDGRAPVPGHLSRGSPGHLPRSRGTTGASGGKRMAGRVKPHRR